MNIVNGKASGSAGVAAFAFVAAVFAANAEDLSCSFEEGLGGWAPAPNIAIDATVAHTGGCSVRLTVNDPMTEEVYVKRTIPVEAGARYASSCWVKTEDVTAAEGRDTPTGAGLMVEWVDGDGKYAGWGSSAYNNFGTRDWFKVESGLLRPSSAARQANIYLCLRGKGKAWFDDFAFTRVEESVPKLEPANGATLTNNCPFFAWRTCRGVTNYVVRLSRCADFAPGSVLEWNAGGRTCFQLEKPLDDGDWYWKVTATGLDDREPWRFRQTAPAERDCLPPLAAVNAARVVSPSAPFSVHVREAGATPPEVAFEGCRAAVSRTGDGDSWLCSFPAPEGGWARGLTAGELVATDAAGNRRATRFWLLNAPKPPNAVEIDGKGRYREGGKTIFPIGIYEVEQRYFPTVKEAGFDIVHLYRWERDRDDAACREYLAGSRKAGLRGAFVGFDRTAIIGGDLEHIARRVAALADQAGLFCWYLYDEPESMRQFVSPDALGDCADLIRRLDPYHPVAASTWGNAAYRRSWDTHWTQAYGNPAESLAEADRQRSRLGDTPVTLLVYCNDDKQALARRLGTPPNHDAFGRDRDWMRACAFLSIVRECNGEFWWWFSKDSDWYYPASQSPKAWADLTGIVREIRSVRRFVAAEGPVVSGTAESGEDKVAWWRKTVDGKTLFIAVNTADHPVSVTVAVPGDAVRTLDLRRYEVLTEGF